LDHTVPGGPNGRIVFSRNEFANTLAQGDSRKGETNAKEDFLEHDPRRLSDDDRGQGALAV
jgi:hypothetical protein